MSRNGSGVQSSPGSSFPAVANTLIESTKFNNVITDINNVLTQSISNDGQTPILANLPMGGFKHTGAAAGAVAGEYVEYAQAAAQIAAAIAPLAALAGATFTGKIGYTSPVSVTQLTSKVTGVTANGLCGNITMSSAALAAGGTAVFTLSNTSIASGDIVNLAISDGASIGSYRVAAENSRAGTVYIILHNDTGGSLSEPVVISFAIFKAS